MGNLVTRTMSNAPTVPGVLNELPCACIRAGFVAPLPPFLPDITHGKILVTFSLGLCILQEIDHGNETNVTLPQLPPEHYSRAEWLNRSG